MVTRKKRRFVSKIYPVVIEIEPVQPVQTCYVMTSGQQRINIGTPMPGRPTPPTKSSWNRRIAAL